MAPTAGRGTITAISLVNRLRNGRRWICLKILPKLPPPTNSRSRYEK